MVTLTSVRDTVWMLVIAALVGAVGAIAGELVALRGAAKDTGGWERARRNVEDSKPSYRDFGSWASIPIGLVAGPLAVVLLSPVERGADDVRRYAVERLVGLALVAGVAGPAFLRQAAERMVAEIDAAVAKNGLQLTQAALGALTHEARADVPETYAAVAHRATTTAVLQAAQVPRVRPGHYKL